MNKVFFSFFAFVLVCASSFVYGDSYGAAARRPAAYRIKKSAIKKKKAKLPEKKIKYISKETYVSGGLTAIVGFGLGHAILGRYKEKGWIFTLSEAAALALTLTSIRFHSSRGQKNVSYLPEGATIIFSTVFIGLKIWEAVDVWNLPSYYKVVPGSPYFLYNRSGAEFGLALSYKF